MTTQWNFPFDAVAVGLRDGETFNEALADPRRVVQERLGDMVKPSFKNSSNLLYFGDNLEGLHRLALMRVSVDLVYIDPPFGTSNEFLIDKHRANSISASGVPAYSDRTQGDEYLEALATRLRALRGIMAERASIYVHIDVKMEHYVRLLMDEVFGARNFRNSITRVKCNPKNFDRHSYGNIKDTILFYSKSPNSLTWNPQHEPLTDEQVNRLYPRTDPKGRRFTTTPLHAPGHTANGPTGKSWRGMSPPVGRHWRYPPDRLDELDAEGLIYWSVNGNPRKIRYADEVVGALPQDVWWFKDPQYPSYPTQKNTDMLDRIIGTSSNPGDIVLDCYAGSGGTLLQAANLGRQFIGMDNSCAAQTVIERRLQDASVDYSYISISRGPNGDSTGSTAGFRSQRATNQSE